MEHLENNALKISYWKKNIQLLLIPHVDLSNISINKTYRVRLAILIRKNPPSNIIDTIFGEVGSYNSTELNDRIFESIEDVFDYLSKLEPKTKEMIAKIIIN